MTKITDAEMDALTSRLENLSYNGQDSLTEMSEIYKNSLMAEQLRFMLATKELDPKPTAQEVGRDYWNDAGRLCHNGLG